VTVNVLEPLGVEIEALSVEKKDQRTLKVGEGVNFVAKMTGSGTITLQWNHSADGVAYEPIKGATGDQYRINPAAVADKGFYTITARNGIDAPVTSAAVELVVKKVPVILVNPASVSVITSGSAASSPVSATFAVVARYEPSLTYQWYKNGDAIPGATSSVLRLADVRAMASGSYEYKVRVTNGEGYVETSAKLNVLTGGTVPTTLNAGAAGTAFAPKAWWVYWTKATKVSDPLTTLSGYWLLERKLSKEGETVTGVTTGSAVWILGSTETARVTADLKTDEWSEAAVTTQDVSASERGEFSAVAYRVADAKTFTLSGRVESGGDAALYGAPEVMDGDYNLSLDGIVNDAFAADLSWDAEQSMLIGAMETLSDVEDALKANLLHEFADIRGE
jgi:hypothetical protein